jgi:hypothetical protein
MRVTELTEKENEMFYRFHQNNSGGAFDKDDKVAVTVHIEANSAAEANQIAQQHGIYFNGVDDEIDCECCGDRWYEVDESGGSEEVYTSEYDDMWVQNGEVYAYVYMLDGTKKELIKGE